MAQEQGIRVFRQASDDAREMAMRVRSTKLTRVSEFYNNNKLF